MGEVYGYARVSTADQAIEAQTDKLRAAGCTRIWEETASGAVTARPELDDLLDDLRPGDTLVVWRLDRLGRNTRHLLETVEALSTRDVGFRSLTEAIDTTTATGKLVLTIFAAIADFERELIRERTHLGLEAARRRGNRGGRPKVMNDAKLRQAKRMRDNGIHITEIVEALGVSRSTLYRYLT